MASEKKKKKDETKNEVWILALIIELVLFTFTEMVEVGNRIC